MELTKEQYDALITANGDLRKDLADLAGVVQVLTGSLGSLITQVEEREASNAERLDDLLGKLIGFDITDVPEEEQDDEQRATRIGLIARVEEIEALVRGRNRSAPVKRNMTDDDAVRVLQGDAVAMDHKDAGEFLGLTYAQVYSCRLEYTFKHVLKRLKETGWKNPWVKK